MYARRAEAVRLLVKAGAKVDATDQRGRTALMIAVGDRRLDVVRELLAAGATAATVDLRGESALHRLRRDHPEMIPLLIAAGATLDARNGRGETPLYAAMTLCESEVAAALLAAGATLSASNDEDRKALLHFARCGSLVAIEIVLRLVDSPDVAKLLTNAFFGAVRSNNVPALTRLLDDGRIGVDATTHWVDRSGSADNFTGLMVAVSPPRVGAARFLIARGVPLDARDSEGRTALIIAAGHGEIEMVKLLLHASAAVNLQARDGSTALMRAVDETRTVGSVSFSSEAARACYGDVTLVQLLLSHGADPRVKDADGLTALDWAKRADCRIRTGPPKARKWEQIGSGPAPVINLLEQAPAR
jgi:ankyrin repeat protein